MKKKIIGIVAAITIALVGLTGCGAGERVDSSTNYDVDVYEYEGHTYLIFDGHHAIAVIEVK